MPKRVSRQDRNKRNRRLIALAIVLAAILIGLLLAPTRFRTTASVADMPALDDQTGRTTFDGTFPLRPGGLTGRGTNTGTGRRSSDANYRLGGALDGLDPFAGPTIGTDRLLASIDPSTVLNPPAGQSASAARASRGSVSPLESNGASTTSGAAAGGSSADAASGLFNSTAGGVITPSGDEPDVSPTGGNVQSGSGANENGDTGNSNVNDGDNESGSGSNNGTDSNTDPGGAAGSPTQTNTGGPGIAFVPADTLGGDGQAPIIIAGPDSLLEGHDGIPNGSDTISVGMVDPIPTPEPATLLMLGGGLVIAGQTLRRRRNLANRSASDDRH